jgi:peptidoglycan/xylan/chitin deacetylase (PgdA/CDA1 family)
VTRPATDPALGRSPRTPLPKRLALSLVGTVVGADVPDEIALTFDDGPDRDVTPAVLEVLGRHGAKATFFVLTEHALVRPELLRRILDEGHEIALHFDRHDRITDLPPLAALRRMRAARRRLAKLVGTPVALFRPPYGDQNLLTYLFARLLGLRVIGWSQAAEEWIEQSAESAANRAAETLRGGDVILMHDGLELGPGAPRPSIDRAHVADLVLREAAERGLRSVTVGALLRRGPPRRRRWFQ